MHEAKYYLDGALERCHPEILTSLEDLYEFLLYFRGAVNAYGKCFVSSTGHRKLDRKELFTNEDGLLAMHQRTMDLRHKYVAHSDENEIDSVDINVAETDADIRIELNYHTSFPYDRLYELRSLVKHATDYMVDQQARQIQHVSRTTGKTVIVGHQEPGPGKDGEAERGDS